MDDAVYNSVATAASRKLSRREMLGVGGALLLGGGIATGFRWASGHERGMRAEVFIGKARDYHADFTFIIQEGFAALGIGRGDIQGKRILLKPNLVETAPGQAHINTHPAVIVGAVEALRRLDARAVIVAEGHGHHRDSRLILDESGTGAALEEAGADFVDLNHDEFVAVPNRGGWTNLAPLYLPKTLLSADWVISVPKLKTHHWAGVTCSMKNLFGVMPGVVYGWPKNVLHYAGIPESILDINATVKPSLAIVDAVVGMEGDGPIMGTPKEVGCIVMGRNLPAVDATCVRMMDLNPYGVPYLAQASGRLGPIHESNIAQRGEPIAALRTRFQLLDAPHLKSVASS
ncbi:MAG: DUF362 domain-containing protein [Planctomycetota bacterium]